MKNIFENARFGDKFKTRDGRCAVLVNRDNEAESVFAYVSERDGDEDYGEFEYSEDGVLKESYEVIFNKSLHQLDIVSKWSDEYASDSNPEYIALAAVYYDDGREYMFQKIYGVETGFVIGTFRHPMVNDILFMNPKFKASEETKVGLINDEMYNVKQGFITSLGRFVDRKEAFSIALKAGQITEDCGYARELFSEDVFPKAAYNDKGKGIM